LAMPNQYCQTVEKEMWGWFLGDILQLHYYVLHDNSQLLYKMVTFGPEIFDFYSEVAA